MPKPPRKPSSDAGRLALTHLDHLTFQPIPSLPGWASAHLQSVGSTNRILADAFSERGRVLDRHWLTAGEQTKGRGRRDRQWSSPPGNLYASLCLRAEGLSSDKLGILPLAFGIAIHEAVSGLIDADVKLKWPNDVLIGGAKCCGMLIEMHHAAQSRAVITGIGLNVENHPQETPYPATNLHAHGFKGDLDTIFNALAHAVHDVIVGIEAADFITHVRQDWLARAKGVGEPVTVRLAKETLNGIFDTLNDDGQLVLRLSNDTTKTISAGDVFFA